MKNFTNNFKQFTSRLSARWLIIALMLLLGTSSAWAADLYIKGNPDAKIWIWTSSENYTGGKWDNRPQLQNTDYFTKIEANIYKYTKSNTTLPDKISIKINDQDDIKDVDNISTKYIDADANKAKDKEGLDLECSIVNSESIVIEVESSINPYIWAWQDDASETKLVQNTIWPGDKLNGNSNVYSVEYKPTTLTISIIFTNNSNHKTPDIKNLKVGKRYRFSYNGSNSNLYEIKQIECLASLCIDSDDVNPGTVNVKPANDKYCAGEDYQLSINPTAIGGYTTTIQWQKKDGNNYSNVGSNSTLLNLENLVAGTYTYRATVTWTKGTCTVTESTADKSFTVNALPSAPQFDTAPLYCAGDEITLPTEDKAKNSVTWYKQDGSDAGTPLNTAGTYTYKAKATNTNGCVSSDYGTYSYKVKSLATASNYELKNTTAVYTGTAVTLQKSDVIVKNDAAAVTNIYFKQDAINVGTYKVYVTTEANDTYCAATELEIGTFTINKANQIDNFAITNDQTKYCGLPSEAITLTSTGGSTDETVIYESGDNTVATIDGSELSVLKEGTVTITATRPGGDNYNNITATKQFTFYKAPDKPTDYQVVNIQKCKDGSTNGKIVINNVSPAYVYTINPETTGNAKDGFVISNARDYIVTVTRTVDGCTMQTNSDPIIVGTDDNTPAATVSISGETSFCEGGNTTLTCNTADVKGQITAYQWYNGNTPIQGETNQTYITSAAGNYKVEVTVINSDCEKTFDAEVNVEVNELPEALVLGKTEETVCPNTQFTLPTIDGKWYAQEEGGSAYVSNTITNGVAATTYYYAEAVKNGCSSATRTRYTVNVHTAPVKPTITFSANPVGQKKPTTLTVGEYNGTLNNYTLYKDGVSQGEYTTPQTITIGEVDEYDYYVVATSKACPSLTATSETVTLKVQEAGAKIVQLGDLTIYTNIKTDFVPMYVQKDGIVDVDGASSVKAYTWQYSQDGNSWDNCATNYASGVVGMSNGGADCNNWRADKAGRYRCLITYDNDGTQYSNVLSVAAATKTAPAVNAFGDLPIISVNTGSNSFPDECSVSSNQYPSANADKMKKKVSVDVKIYDKAGKLQYDRKARMNYRGSSSLNFKKKSYAFVTGKEKTKNDKGDVDTGKANLFGLSNGAEDKDWVLYAATPDPSMMRNRLVFDLYKKMTDEWGVNSMYVELIVNNEYKGVYVLMDKITNNVNRVNITASGGFIVKFDKTDVVDRVENVEGDQKTFATTRTGTGRADWYQDGITSYDVKIDQRFEIEYPEKEDVEDAGGNWEATYGAIQKRFEDFETALEKKDYTTVRSIIDYDSWADWFIINEYTKNMDAYRASCIFVYNGNKIEARPLWDQELTFNNVVANIQSVGANSTSGLLIQNNGVYSDKFKAPFWFTGGGTSITGGLLNDPCFVSLVKQKWATYKEGVLSSKEVGNMVDNYTTELTSNAITRENTMLNFNSTTRGQTSTCTGSKAIGYYGYEDNTGSATTHANSKDAIKSWVTSRIPALTTAINGLEGEALIFTVSPSTVETTPWQQVILTVNAPEGYEYTVSYPDLTAAGAIIKEGNNTYGIKIPRPVDDWGTAGNGDPEVSKEYEFTANIEVSGENACGTMQEGTATSTITLKDVTEECSPEIKP